VAETWHSRYERHSGQQRWWYYWRATCDWCVHVF